jgi:hypothetical protein
MSIEETVITKFNTFLNEKLLGYIGNKVTLTKNLRKLQLQFLSGSLKSKKLPLQLNYQIDNTTGTVSLTISVIHNEKPINKYTISLNNTSNWRNILSTSFEEFVNETLLEEKLKSELFVDLCELNVHVYITITYIPESTIMLSRWGPNKPTSSDPISTDAVLKFNPETTTSGGQQKVKYNGRLYSLRTGTRGGKYILVKDKRVYIK